MRAVLFDFDDTLIDTTKVVGIALNRVAYMLYKYLLERKIHVDLSILEKNVREISVEMNFKRIYDRNIWWIEVLRRNNINITPDKDFLEKVTKTFWYTLCNAKPYRDTIPILNYLKDKGYLIGLVTDTDHYPRMKKYRIRKSGLEKYFDAIIIAGEDVPEIKPSPKPFEKILEILNVKRDDAIMVGDKPFTDIEGAKRAGLKTVLIVRKKWDYNIKPDYTIYRLMELKNIL